MTVLITGATGTIGRHLTRALEVDHELRLGDIAPANNDSRSVSLDVTNLSQAQAAMQGIDAVCHLAIFSGYEGDHEDDAVNQQRFDVNVKGTWNVLEAARREGVKRFVYTSSLMVVWGYDPPTEVAAAASPFPVGTYAMTKHLGEVLCEDVARQYGLSTVCLRIPKPVDIGDPSWKQRMLRPQWIAMPDLIEAYKCALTAPEIDFEIVTIVGDSSKRRWDLSKAEQVLGYRPKHRLEDEGYNVTDETAPLFVE